MQRLILDALKNRRVHDLRAVSHELAVKNHGISHCHFISPKWQASFSRAVRRLVQAGMIECRRHQIRNMPDGPRFGQRRFARLPAEIHNT
jgi:hypothetical protein